jgi:hypothetical protein
MALFLGMKNLIVNKHDIHLWLERGVCNGREDLYQHMVWALGEDMRPFEDSCIEIDRYKARNIAQGVSEKALRHPKNYHYLQFVPENISPDLLDRLFAVKKWLVHSLDSKEPWLHDTPPVSRRPKILAKSFEKLAGIAYY